MCVQAKIRKQKEEMSESVDAMLGGIMDFVGGFMPAPAEGEGAKGEDESSMLGGFMNTVGGFMPAPAEGEGAEGEEESSMFGGIMDAAGSLGELIPVPGSTAEDERHEVHVQNLFGPVDHGDLDKEEPQDQEEQAREEAWKAQQIARDEASHSLFAAIDDDGSGFIE